MNDEQAFIAAIVAKPEDDAPRLVFADWLDETGQTRRAVYIRAAIRQFRETAPPCPKPGKIIKASTGEYTAHCRCRKCVINRAVFESYKYISCDLTKDFYQPFADYEVAESLRTGRPIRHDWREPARRCELSRGFVSTVHVSADDWLRFGESIVQRMPVETVRLITRPVGFPPDQIVTGPDIEPGTFRVARWPGIVFHVPDPFRLDLRHYADRVPLLDPRTFIHRTA